MQNFNYYPAPEEAQANLAETAEKKKLLRAAIAVTGPCFVFFLVTEFYRQIVLFIGSSLGFSQEQTLTFLRDPYVLQTVQIAMSLIVIALPFAVCAKIYGFNISRFAALKRPKNGTRLPYFLFGVGFCAFANIAVTAAGRVFERFGFKDTGVKDVNPDGVWGLLLSITATAIVPALVEEFAFRGIVQGILLPFGEAFSVFASAAVFGMVHGNFEQIPFAFLVGLVVGFIRVKTGSIAVCMAVHAANNLIAVLASYPGVLPVAISNIIYTVYVLLALTLSILGVTLIKGEGKFSFSEHSGALSAKKRYVGFFFSFPFLAVFMVYLFRAVSRLL